MLTVEQHAHELTKERVAQRQQVYFDFLVACQDFEIADDPNLSLAMLLRAYADRQSCRMLAALQRGRTDLTLDVFDVGAEYPRPAQGCSVASPPSRTREHTNG